MTKQRRKLSRKKRFIFHLVTLLIPATTISTIYLLYAAYRTTPVYWGVKLHQRGWQGKVHRADAELGFVPVPDSHGAEIFSIGNNIPMRFDKDGFRVPVDDERATSPNLHPIVLALGCSFTYGAATAAENTYPFLVGQYLGGTTRNAGVSSYGLSQMMVLARRLIPAYKPDYLLVQYSPWLVDRARNQFAPTDYGKVPTPYFFGRQNELALHPPVFMTKALELPIDRYRETPVTVMDRVSFLWNVGLPLFVHDDFYMSYYNIERAFGGVPDPATNPEQITKYVYEEIARVARENRAKLVIVVLGIDYQPVPIPDAIPPDSIIVDAHGALLKHLPVVDQETYEKFYFHWCRSPLRIIDIHPNEDAHRLIAQAIIDKLQDQTKMQPDNSMLPNTR